MGTIFVFFNAIAYLILFIIGWKRRKQFDIYVFITLLYALTAVFCYYNYLGVKQSYPDIGLVAFIYLFVALSIFLSPIKGFNINQKTLVLDDNSLYRVLAYIFIAFAAYDIFTSLAHTQEIIISGEYAELRNQGYADDSDILLYDNQYQRFAKNMVGYLQPFGVAYFFLLLTLPRPKRVLTFLISVSIVVPSFYAAVADASRGMIIGLMLHLLIGYLLFEKYIPKHRKKILYVGATIVMIGFVAYLIAVTISRFGDEANDSLFEYLGHSMLAFNDGLFYNLTQHSYGKKFFDFILDMFDLGSMFPSAIGNTHDKAFVTFIGSLFIDFGIIGTLIVAFIGVAIIKRFFQKRTIRLSDAIMIIFYSNTIASGITVSPKNRALTWVMTFVVYYIVRLCEKNRIMNNKTRKSCLDL